MYSYLGSVAEFSNMDYIDNFKHDISDNITTNSYISMVDLLNQSINACCDYPSNGPYYDEGNYFNESNSSIFSIDDYNED